MFESKTVFIVGAGASADLNLPLGTTLRDKMSELLLPIARGKITSAAMDIIWEALRRRAKENGETDNGLSYRKAASHIASHIRLVRSIDEFIDHHSGDRHLELVAKVAICWLILEAESKSWLLRVSPYGPALNLPRMQEADAWLLELWNLMRAGTHVREPRRPFENVSFIVFNYDRCVEVFLTHALIELFRIGEVEARAIVNEVPILHPYGRVGRPDETGAEFGTIDNVSSAKLIKLAGSIRTFGESERDEQQMAVMRELVKSAANLVFIGFAFHDQNLDFFECERVAGRPDVFASAYGLPPEHRSDIRAALMHKISAIKPGYDFEPKFRECRGAELLRIYDKPLRR